MYCKQCGAEIGKESRFCPACGAPVPEEIAAAEPMVAVPSPKEPVDRRRIDFVTLLCLHAALALMAALLLLLLFVPTLKFDLHNGYFFYDKEAEHISIGRTGEWFYAMGNGENGAGLRELVFNVLTVILFVIPLVLSILLILLPIPRRRVLKRRHFVFPIITGFWCLLGYAFWGMYITAAMQSIPAEAELQITPAAGGVLLVVLTVAWLALSFVAAGINGRICRRIRAKEAAAAATDGLLAWRG